MGDAYRGDSAYEAEPARLPVAKTAAEIIAEVRDNAEWRALVPGLRHNSAESAITSSMIAVWCEVQEDNADERKEHKKTKKKRAEDEKEALGWLRILVESNEELREKFENEVSLTCAKAKAILKKSLTGKRGMSNSPCYVSFCLGTAGRGTQ